MSDVTKKASEEARWGRVWRYEGKRAVVWRIRYVDATGRRVLETLGKEPLWNRRRAERELRRRLVDVERNGYRKPERITFAEFAERWFNDYLPARNLKATTVRNYRSSLERHLLPFFGRYDLAKLEAEPEVVDRFIATKMREGLAPKTVSNLVIDLGVVLKRAVRWRLMRSNPVRDAERRRLEPPKCRS